MDFKTKIKGKINNGNYVHLMCKKNDKYYYVDDNLNMKSSNSNYGKFRYFEKDGKFWLSYNSSYIKLDDVVTQVNNKIVYDIIKIGTFEKIGKIEYMIVPCITYIKTDYTYESYTFDELIKEKPSIVYVNKHQAKNNNDNIATLTVPGGIGSVFIIVGMLLGFSILALIITYFIGPKLGLKWNPE